MTRGSKLRCSALVVVAMLTTAHPDPCVAQPREAPIAEGRRALSVQGQRYGVLPDDHATAQRARAVFEKIVHAAGRPPGLVLEVRVLDTPRIIGQALPGGLVVASRGLLDLAGTDNDALAFVLGHEVAHLVRGHHATLQSLGLLGKGRPDATATADQAHAYRAIELEADRLGVLFAALAGYDPAAAGSIIQKLVASAGPDALHPSRRERADAIRQQLADVAAHLEVFRLGLYLLGALQYRDAARVLEHFATIFPGREVLSAAGVAWHKEALRYARAPKYQHLLAVDASTRALLMRDSSQSFRLALDRAIALYAQAVDADPSYAPAINNLAAAHLDLGERELALGYVARALKADPRLASAYNNRGVLHALVSEPRQAEEDWQRALALEPGRSEVIENLARLQESRGNMDEARAWRVRLPIVENQSYVAQSLDGIAPGTSREQVRAQVVGLNARTIQVPFGGGSEDDFVLHVVPGRDLVVALRGGVVEAVAISSPPRVATREGVRPGDSLEAVQRAYGRPTTVDAIQALNLWHYPARGLTLFSSGGRVDAIWAGPPAR
jgi:tetratricopeptide (TPR) repeat protein